MRKPKKQFFDQLCVDYQKSDFWGQWFPYGIAFAVIDPFYVRKTTFGAVPKVVFSLLGSFFFSRRNAEFFFIGG